MCGIVGFITEEVSKSALAREKFMKDALIMDTLRGDDATGVFMVPHAWAKSVKQEDKMAFWLKNAVPGHEFVASQAYNKSIGQMRDWRAVIGHNRAATRGKRDTASAHPFQEGPVTMVHNGTLTTTYGLPQDQWDLNKGRKEEDRVTVDSHVACHNLALVPPERAGEIIGKLRGAFALVWHDSRDDSVNIVRNAQRPLHFAYDKNSRSLYFMSEHEMLYAVTKRNNIALRPVFYPKPGIWMKWKAGTDVLKPETQEVELYTQPESYGYYNSRGRFQDGYGSGYSGYYRNGVWHSYQQEREEKAKTGTTPATTPAKTQAPPPQKPVAPGKAAAASTVDDRVVLLGRRRKVPSYHQDSLYMFGLKTEDTLPLLPHQPTYTLPEPGNKVIPVPVEGVLYGGDSGRYSAVVQGVPDALYRNSLMNKIHDRLMWKVRPIGVSFIRNVNGVESPVILCRLVSTHFSGYEDSPVTELAPLDRPETGDMVGGAKVEKGEVMYPGPNNIYVNTEAFKYLVKDGCALCYTPLGIMDAQTIEWIDNFPICQTCAKDGEEGVHAEDL